MLASLLPGLREARTPLAVGYLWLLTGWLVVSGHLSLTTRPKDRFLGSLFDLSVAIGRPASLVALTFGAYVLGSVVTFSISYAPLVALRHWIRPRADSGSMYWYTPRRVERDSARLMNLVARNLAGDVTGGDVVQARRPSRDRLKTMLLAANQEIYGEFDRASSEGEFRLNLVPPLLAIGVVGAVQYSWWLLLAAFVVCGGLVRSADRRLNQSSLILDRAIHAEVLVHPVTALLGVVEPAARQLLDEGRKLSVQADVFNVVNENSARGMSTNFECTLRMANASQGQMTILSFEYGAFLLPGEDAPEQRVLDSAADNTRTLLAPGEHREVHSQVDLLRHRFSPDGEQIVLRSRIRFLDANGDSWLRDWDGVLSRVR